MILVSAGRRGLAHPAPLLGALLDAGLQHARLGVAVEAHGRGGRAAALQAVQQAVRQQRLAHARLQWVSVSEGL